MRNIPTITKNLLIINVLMFAATFVFKSRGIFFDDIFGLHFFPASDFHVYQFVTYMFMHADIMHLFFNMFALWMFGCVVENVWGPKKFILYYMVCGIGAGLIQELAQMGEFYMRVSAQNPSISLSGVFQVAEMGADALNGWNTVGASGAVYAILLAFGMTFPEEKIFIFPLPVPIKAKWFVMIYVVIELLSVMSVSNSNVAHCAHLGGMLFGWMLIRYWRKSGPGGGYGYGGNSSFASKIRDGWKKYTAPKKDNRTKDNADWDYNRRMKERQDEVDRILDKVRRSGYASLTEEEKRTLFNNGK